MVKARQQRIEPRLQHNDNHPRKRKVDIEHQHSRQQEHQQRKHNGPHEQLVEVVVARVDTVAEDVVLLAAEEVEERDEDAELPVEDARRGQVEGVDVDRECGEEVREDGEGHAGAAEAGEADEPDYVRQHWVERVDEAWSEVSLLL